jgi:hypothetical protein
VVHAHHEHGGGVLGRGGDDYLGAMGWACERVGG